MQPICVIPHKLWIGDLPSACNSTLLRQHRITRLLCVDARAVMPSVARVGFEHLAVSVSHLETPDHTPQEEMIASRLFALASPVSQTMIGNALSDAMDQSGDNSPSLMSMSTSGSASDLDDSKPRPSRPSDLFSVLPACFDFIDQKGSDEITLIHCLTGNEQCIIVAMAYLMIAMQLSLIGAARIMKQKIPSASPPAEYLFQLIEMEKLFRHLENPTTTLKSLVTLFYTITPASRSVEQLTVPAVNNSPHPTHIQATPIKDSHPKINLPAVIPPHNSRTVVPAAGHYPLSGLHKATPKHIPTNEANCHVSLPKYLTPPEPKTTLHSSFPTHLPSHLQPPKTSSNHTSFPMPRSYGQTHTSRTPALHHSMNREKKHHTNAINLPPIVRAVAHTMA
ncbi:hypothetical protein Pelo_11685 [Pelomyxa schiedti]|nr:hypothetical protein Pelo_11685 [Pelomyxa schiedti]